MNTPTILLKSSLERCIFCAEKSLQVNQCLPRNWMISLAVSLLSEDRGLSSLFKESMNSIEDYIHYATRLKADIKPHLIALLQAGVTVVLGFPANTLAGRQWIM